jgi:ABC-type multidrug transport system ATPase subunit
MKHINNKKDKKEILISNFFRKNYFYFFIKKYYLFVIPILIMSNRLYNLVFKINAIIDKLKNISDILIIKQMLITISIYSTLIFMIIIIKVFIESYIKNDVKNRLRKKLFLLLMSFHKGKNYKNPMEKYHAFNLFFSYFSESALCLIHLLDGLLVFLFTLYKFYETINSSSLISSNIFIPLILLLVIISLLNLTLLSQFNKNNKKFVKLNKIIYENILLTYYNKKTVLQLNNLKSELDLYKQKNKNVNHYFYKSSFFKALALSFSRITYVFFVIFFFLYIRNVDIFRLCVILFYTLANKLTTILEEFIKLDSSFAKVIDAFIDLLDDIKDDKKSIKSVLSHKHQNYNFFNKRRFKYNYKNNINKKTITFDKNINQLIKVDDIVLKSNLNKKDNILKINSFIVNENDKIVHIKGKNGSGKSTFIKLISGELSFYSGNITMKHKNVLSILNDNISLFNKRSLLENILYSLNYQDIQQFYKNYYLNKQVNKKILNILQKTLIIVDMNFKYFEKFFFKKINISKFSSGQKQKIKLSMIIFQFLFYNKKILILDEPLTNIDYISSNKIINNIVNIKNMNLIIISHTFTERFKDFISKLYLIENGILKQEK